MIKLIIFDLDDTLISTQPLYLDKIHRLGLKMSMLGFEYYEAIELEKQIDRVCLKTNGVAKHRFPTSLAQTYKELCSKYDKEISEEVVAELTCLGYNVFSEPAPPFQESKKILEDLSKQYILCILTKGEKEIQLKRVVDSGLASFFDQSFVTMHKTPELFKSICTFYDTAVEESVMIGNSLPSDILPALEAGLYGIHLEQGTFNYEETLHFNSGDYPKYSKINSLFKIGPIIKAYK